MQVSFRTALNREATALALYIGLAVWVTWPLFLNPLTRVPVGTSPSIAVPFLNIWSVWWNVDRLGQGFEGYWHAPIFHPHSGTFAYSEPQPTTVIVAPVLWLSGSRVLAYNVYLWFSLILNGMLARRLLLRRHVGSSLSLAGGAAILLLPIVHWQRDVLQLIPLWGILWTWMAYWSLREQPGVKRGVILGLALASTASTCVHHAIMLLILLTPIATFQCSCSLLSTKVAQWRSGKRALKSDSRRTQQFIQGATAAVLVSLLLIGPMFWQIRHAVQEHRVDRSPELLESLSALPLDYTTAWGHEWARIEIPGVISHWRLSPGGLKSVLALCGCVLTILWRRKRAAWTVFLILMAWGAFLLSLGTNLDIAGWVPWESIRLMIPGAQAVRNLFRFAYFYQIAIALLAVQSLHLLVLLSRRLRVSPTTKLLLGRMIVLTAWIAVGEVIPHHVMLSSVPDDEKHRPWCEFVQQETPPGSGILVLPMAPGNLLQDFHSTAQAMYLGTFHGVPMVNGYSGIFPQDDFELRAAVHEGLSVEIIRDLQDRNVSHVIVIHEFDLSGRYRNFGESKLIRETMTEVLDEPGVATVYRLDSSPVSPPSAGNQSERMN